jgi:hypothetical protein
VVPCEPKSGAPQLVFDELGVGERVIQVEDRELLV